MADMKIDDATQDSAVSGAEVLPISDAGAAKNVSIEQIKGFVLGALGDLTEAVSTSVSEDGVYIRQGGAMKRVSEAVLAQAMMDYAFALTGIVTPNGNERFVIDDNGTKKTMTLEKLTAYVTANYADIFTSLGNADPMAASDGIVVKQGNSVKKGTLGALATFVQSTLASYFGSCVNVLNVQDSDKIVVVSGGATKTMLVSQFMAALSAVQASVPGATTVGNVPVWSTTTGGLGDGLGVQTTVRAQGTAANTALPTEAAVRAAIEAEATARSAAISSAVAGVGDVKAPLTTTADKVPQWDSTAKKLKDGLAVTTSIGSTASDTKLPTEKAVKDAIASEASARTAAIASESSARTAAISTATENMAEKSGSTVSGHLAAWNSNGKLVDSKGVVTSVGTPGSDDNVPTEKAVRSAIAAAVASGTSGLADGDVKGPQSTTENKIPQWDSANKKLKDGKTVQTSVRASASATDDALPTEKAVRTAIDAKVASEASSRTTAITAAVASEASARTSADEALGARIDEIDALTGPATTTENKVPQWDSTNRKLKDGLPLQTTVRNSANASHSALATEKAVRDAVDARVGAPLSHTENAIPVWGAVNELKPGKSVVTVIANNASDDNIPTEKAVRDALPIAATTSTAGLMSAADKSKLDGLVDTSAVAEIGANLADADTVIVKQGDSTNKKSLMSRFWTYIMGKLVTYKIDDLAPGNDNTDLNTSTSRHGLCPKLSGDTSHFLRGDGMFAVPTGSTDFTGDSGTGGVHGLVPAPATGDAAANKFLCADGSWAQTPAAAGVDIPGATAIDAPADADLLYLFDSSVSSYRKATLAQVRAMLFGTKRYDTIFIPAGAMTPTDGNGATPGAVKFVDATHDTMAFPSTADKSVEFSVAMPDDWDRGAVKAKVLWTFYDSTAGQSGQAVRWQLGAITARDGDDISDAPTEYTNIDDMTQSANELCRSGASAAITAEGTVEAGGFLHFTLKRDADYAPSGGTALSTEALALGVVIQFGRTADFTGW